MLQQIWHLTLKRPGIYGSGHKKGYSLFFIVDRWKEAVLSGMESCNHRCRWAAPNTRWPKWLVDVWGVYMCAFCTFLNDPLQLGALSAFTWYFSGRHPCLTKWEVPVIFKLFPKVSIVLEQIYMFRTSVIAELAVSDLLSSFPCLFRLDQEDWVSAWLGECTPVS